MTALSFEGGSYVLQDGESVLDCLLRNGQQVQHSCKSGLCQSCLIQASGCEVPDKAKSALKGTLQASGYALACQWFPTSDVAVRRPQADALVVQCRILAVALLNPAVMLLLLEPVDAGAAIECRPGQYMNLTSSEGITRSYSVANDYQRDGVLEFHIARTAHGRFTGWLFDLAAAGDRVTVRGPAGTCFYLPQAEKTEPLLLAGVGTGLAPLYGILNDALAQGHQGPMTLVHGSGRPELLYYRQKLQQLAQRHANFRYLPVVLENPANDASCRQGDAVKEALAALDIACVADTRVYLCGNPAFVQGLRRQVFLKGVRSSNIHCDAFVERAVPAG
jgi:CDP-4-dehydro-6-deoxyglucose reductase